MTKKKKKKNALLEKLKQSRPREWIVSPVTKVVKNKKAHSNKKACRVKVGEDQ